MKSASASSVSRSTRRTPICAADRPARTGRRRSPACRTPRPLGDEDPDPAESDDADGLLEQLDAGVARPLPLVLQRAVRGRHVPRGGEHQGDRELGGGDDVGVEAFTTMTPASVAARTSTLSRPTPARATTQQAGSRRPAPRRPPGGGPDQERVGVDDRGQQLGAVGAVAGADLEVRPSASTVAGLSSSAMSTTGLVTAVSCRSAWRRPSPTGETGVRSNWKHQLYPDGPTRPGLPRGDPAAVHGGAGLDVA